MKVKTLAGVLIFLIVLNISVIGTIVYLHVTNGTPPVARLMDGNPGFTPPYVESIEQMENMTPGQRRQLFQLVESFREKVQPMHDEVQMIDKEMRDLLITSDQIPNKKVEELMRKKADLQFEIGKHVLDNLQRSKSFLTQEQQRMFIDRIMSAGPRSGMGSPPGTSVPGPGAVPGPGMMRGEFDNR
ncbi:Spy/CpxP family protein refolding chaperone [Rhodohalobacter mucosus]|uniref:Periplasmic heavy metal sensor n=1 Tax=Rhodohalobacter mucosus TaxID=2079485 RepID=A0A316TRJ2_9BACT|nr:Spy/CpxP family protein refolding chaperone [Rhodohalobacter mucosus]PWN07040.1 hypothetical protein DDZ15_07155 [Rhodohalobacter mucosus]